MYKDRTESVLIKPALKKLLICTDMPDGQWDVWMHGERDRWIDERLDGWINRKRYDKPQRVRQEDRDRQAERAADNTEPC